ncbi:unnamed protein product [Prorocentrum cordatum]|uniref:Uncharacterized protein n=1 Tax=Prorocentrum cordatum TaxID=2364126 RepID=A0ABN9X7N8_9DINO|nr:unnamed protein product [Polarella glacialis]
MRSWSPTSSLQRWSQRLREGRAVAACAGAAERDLGSTARAQHLGSTARAQRHQLQRWDQRLREERAVAACAGAAERDAGSKAGARRHLQLQRWDQRVREVRAVAAGAGTAERDVFSKAGARRHLYYSAGISACEKGEQWQPALALLSELREAKLEPDSATMLGSARWKGASSGSGRWRC